MFRKIIFCGSYGVFYECERVIGVMGNVGDGLEFLYLLNN